MAFPRRLLADHEELIFDLQPHWIELVLPLLRGIALLLLAAFFYGLTGIFGGSDIDLVNLIVGIGILIAFLAVAALPVLRWRFTNFVLTSDRLITRRGIVAKTAREIPLERINDVTLNQGLLQRLVGAGDLLVESAGERGQERARNLPHPEHVQLQIYEAIEANAERGAEGPAARGRRVPSIPEQLEALDRLRRQGTITQAQFDRKRQELLDRM